MRRRLALALAVALAGAGCDSSKPAPDASTTTANTGAASASASASTRASAPTASSAPTDLKAAGAKPYAATSEQDLGTLPEGVGVAVGAKAPDFELPSVDGGKLQLSTLIEDSWVLLVFYRGGW